MMPVEMGWTNETKLASDTSGSLRGGACGGPFIG